MTKKIDGYIEDKYWFVQSGDLNIISIGKTVKDAVRNTHEYIKRNSPDLCTVMRFKSIGHRDVYWILSDYVIDPPRGGIKTWFLI